MTAILTAVILAWLATGLGLGFGWSRDHIRANKAEQKAKLRAAVRDALAAENTRLRTMLASAEADIEQATGALAAVTAELDRWRGTSVVPIAGRL